MCSPCARAFLSCLWSVPSRPGTRLNMPRPWAAFPGDAFFSSGEALTCVGSSFLPRPQPARPSEPPAWLPPSPASGRFLLLQKGQTGLHSTNRACQGGSSRNYGSMTVLPTLSWAVTDRSPGDTAGGHTHWIRASDLCRPTLPPSLFSSPFGKALIFIWKPDKVLRKPCAYTIQKAIWLTFPGRRRNVLLNEALDIGV